MTAGGPDPFISAGNPCRKSLQDISAMDGTAMDGAAMDGAAGLLTNNIDRKLNR